MLRFCAGLLQDGSHIGLSLISQLKDGAVGVEVLRNFGAGQPGTVDVPVQVVLRSYGFVDVGEVGRCAHPSNVHPSRHIEFNCVAAASARRLCVP